MFVGVHSLIVRSLSNALTTSVFFFFFVLPVCWKFENLICICFGRVLASSCILLVCHPVSFSFHSKSLFVVTTSTIYYSYDLWTLCALQYYWVNFWAYFLSMTLLNSIQNPAISFECFIIVATRELILVSGIFLVFVKLRHFLNSYCMFCCYSSRLGSTKWVCFVSANE